MIWLFGLYLIVQPIICSSAAFLQELLLVYLNFYFSYSNRFSWQRYGRFLLDYIHFCSDLFFSTLIADEASAGTIEEALGILSEKKDASGTNLMLTSAFIITPPLALAIATMSTANVFGLFLLAPITDVLSHWCLGATPGSVGAF